MEIVEQIEIADLDVVGIQESWELQNTDIGSKIGTNRWIGKARKVLNLKKRGEGGVGFLIEEHLFEVVKIAVETKFEESVAEDSRRTGRERSVYGERVRPTVFQESRQ